MPSPGGADLPRSGLCLHRGDGSRDLACYIRGHARVRRGGTDVVITVVRATTGGTAARRVSRRQSRLRQDRPHTGMTTSTTLGLGPQGAHLSGRRAVRPGGSTAINWRSVADGLRCRRALLNRLTGRPRPPISGVSAVVHEPSMTFTERHLDETVRIAQASTSAPSTA